jgi:hypothetical protein
MLLRPVTPRKRLAGLMPEDGDVVIREERREDEFVYLMQSVPAPAQYFLRSWEDAIGRAVAFAKREHVRVWLDNEHDCTLLEDFRLVEQV